ncbi:Carbohydrate kinase, FGGY [Emticicia oligotrophica DSM 17448]|uniref:Carbohydrate kinase, FGGY n=1 Tax=Emticicia oligotrophica (strain DSM 17448 / CIP 109782 / MTCC 6937 / GPTSA100-15) TaxID=929562 RepID=A0ABM5N262_EMTOG|nr:MULTISPECIES: FGGY family carbohydrate kinase [Emticicia]AFK03558.1 Carbohydrate kinase, FGGY [Emticicia oligotrophica DSM 17448]
MLLLGLDIGTSSIKASVVDADTQQVIASAQYPDVEASISSPHAGWAEQDPEMWWTNSIEAIKRVNASGKFDPQSIGAIGIAYQMHGLVMVDKNKKVLRPSIIWCDSRAVEIGAKAFSDIGEDVCLNHLLNSPGNFTASKLAWVKANEPHIYEQCDKIMLPGDYIAMMLTNEITTSNSGLSEGIFWDFQANEVSADVMDYYGFEESLIPTINPVFSNHGEVTSDIAQLLGIKAGIPVTYKAGDQPNNALSLDVLNPGEIAATAGTSGVVYAVSDQVSYDPQSRINSFAHVNHQLGGENRIGILLCINGTGILNRWAKENFGGHLSYSEMNQLAAQAPIGSNGLLVMPFGNGAERMLNNRILGASFQNLDFNIHSRSHIFRAAQEGIAFSLNYGFEIMQGNGVEPKVIRAGNANMFLSDIFSNALVNITNTPVELYDTDGAKGAALGAGFGAGFYQTPKEAMCKLTKLKVIEPNAQAVAEYKIVYEKWKAVLEK